MADELPSATPEKGDDDKTATNAPSNEHGSKIQEKLKPTDTSKRKKSRLTKTEWREFMGTLALILGMWTEIIRCHDFIILCISGTALLLLYVAACHFVLRLLKIEKFAWGLFLWILLAIFTAGVIRTNSQPAELKAHPHFTFFISTPESDKIGLTNDFLAVKEFGGHPNSISGVLFVPVDVLQSNLTLKIWAQNDSSSFAENVEVSLFVPKEWQCEPDKDWTMAELAGSSFSQDKLASGVIETNSMQLWNIKVPSPLLAGNGIITPDIHLHFIQMERMHGSMGIMARAKDSPADAVGLGLWCMQKSIFTSNDFYKPFVARVPIAGFSLDKLKELQK